MIEKGMDVYICLDVVRKDRYLEREMMALRIGKRQ